MKKQSTSAKKIGKALAHVQSALDDVISFGFKKLKEVGKAQKATKKKPKTTKEKGVTAMRKAAGFLGQAGESFYQTYEELKAKKTKDRQIS